MSLRIRINNNLDFRTGPTHTSLYGQRRRLEALNFGFKKKRNCAIRVAKPNALISCTVTAQLIYPFVFAYIYANCCISYAAAYSSILIISNHNTTRWQLKGTETKIINVIEQSILFNIYLR